MDRLRRIKNKRHAAKAVATKPPSAATKVTAKPASIPAREPTNFFSLPIELRNEIYCLHVESESIAVFRHPSSKTKPAPIAMRLVCKQAWTEYLPIILSTAPINFTITDLDFRPLIRLLGSLRRAELIALRQNNDLIIKLVLLKHQKADIDLKYFRRWLVKRSEYMDRLQFEYEFDEEVRPAANVGRTMNLTAYLHAFSDLRGTLHESLIFELEPIEDALKAEQAVLVDPSVRQRRLGNGAPGVAMSSPIVSRHDERESRAVRWPYTRYFEGVSPVVACRSLVRGTHGLSRSSVF